MRRDLCVVCFGHVHTRGKLPSLYSLTIKVKASYGFYADSFFRSDSVFCFVTRKRLERFVLLALAKQVPDGSDGQKYIFALQLTVVVQTIIVYAIPLLFNIVIVILINFELNKKSQAYSKILISPTSRKKWKKQRKVAEPVLQRPLPTETGKCFVMSKSLT